MNESYGSEFAVIVSGGVVLKVGHHLQCINRN